MRNNKVDADRHGQRPPLVLPASKCPPPTAPSRYRVSLLGSPAQVSDTAGTIATGSRVLGRIAVGCGVVGVAVLCLLSGGDSQSRSALEVANIRHAFWDRPGDRVDGSRSTRADSNELSRTARGAQLNAKGLAAGDGPRHTGRGTSALGSGEQARRDHEGDVAFGGAEFFARKVNRSEALEDHGGHSGEYRGGADVTEDDPVSNVGARRRMTAAGKGGVLRGSNLDENGSSRPENDSDGDGIRRMRSSSRNTGRPTRTYTRGPRARRAVDLEVVDDRLDLSGTQDDGEAESSGQPFVKRYKNFQRYAAEQAAHGNSSLPVPIVSSPKGPEASRSIPLAVIIGVQKGGTQNLRSHLLMHPMLSGRPGKEAHFLDWYWLPTNKKKKRIEWPGDGHDGQPLSSQAVGNLLSAYADRAMQAVAPSDRDTKATVESTPVYVFFPLAPFRMKMILPHAKLVVILRDPTERYFSHLRMAMCWTRRGEHFEELEKRQDTLFHTPGDATGYLEKGAASYAPYTPLCRGMGATAEDLGACSRRMQSHNPLHRGLYADQLERWFRVYDRSQILILESSEMFGDFVGTLAKVTEHIGLPLHDYGYDSRHQHSSSLCETNRPELFAKGQRYDKMREDEKIFRDWYRPHNRRLARLLGRELPWE